MMTQFQNEDLTLHTDYYELNMMYTYWKKGLHNRRAVFEVYFRKLPFDNGFAVFAGLEHVVNYLKNLSFSDSDIDYLREYGEYDEEFLRWLKDMQFSCTVRSALEGDLVFNEEPIFQVEGPLAQCQLIETAVLNMVNFQTLIATKAARIKTVCGDDPVMEFGSRRAQEVDAAIWGTRAAYIAGFDATSNVLAGKLFGIPISGTHAHALVQTYRNEYDAFKAYATTHKNCVFLVDTYDTLKSGVPSAIKVAREMGDKINFLGVRIDSGDMAYISKRVRKQLDEAGFPNAKIYASNDLDEKTVLNLKMQDAKIDVWGIGTKVITAFDQPALGAVYKLVSIEDAKGNMMDTLKLSSNAAKISTPGKKQVWRITNNEKNDKSEGDYVTFWNEDPREHNSLYMFHPQYTYINKTVEDFQAKPLLHDIFVNGKLVYDLPTVKEIKDYCAANLDSLWDEYKRILNPQVYPVDLSSKLYSHKMKYIEKIRNDVNNIRLGD
ncbi:MULTISPECIES: nicotinate phosphoribosyltransferase [Companilactobacillus]|jgi:nicotinate phosphoribosyltransferase|uniref:Nicotinate phosphoribosyltransferase n=3 Tax=Companilactobacillus TaxID=2767879 RepID=A0A0H4LA16_9LACO|nr:MULTISPECIES: nicotinate phosphoribosyltransferase [Companilactobacillus]AKP03298.1 nicotinate phosphoribosyltransferase [Companilactobacillus farciminis]AKS51597.1 nicotinate phosphoribosyltransferase [Companilactobacillus farciminis]ATO45744.1 nicotinate phosphoribosyltransferase [Companilactobacillus farciminis KCTC 3681 = DSM 20184]KRK62371.1 nicotinate phosphoribosyltransferase [Companilactobacillus farciminis KCTC 3681 = DSM 20184]MDG5112400.1 nicotinate phosphoribosyltransferase [Com